MALSKDWTAARFFRDASRDALGRNYTVNDATFVERFQLMNQVQDSVAGLIYDLVGNLWMEEAIAVLSTTGKWAQSPGNTNFVAATRTLTVTSISSAFAAGDEGNLVIFRKGTSIYVGSIESVTNATNIVIKGDNIPTADVTNLDSVNMAATTPSGNVISLTNLRIMKTGQQLKIEVASTATTQVDAVSSIDYDRFLSTDIQNLYRIVFSLVGENLNMRRGFGLSTFGTLTIRYPRVPYRLTTGSSLFDIPDGPAIQVGLIKCSQLIRVRMGFDQQQRDAEIRPLVEALLRQFGGAVNTESVKEKIAALV